MKNGFPELAALDSAIDENQDAFEWLKKNNYPFHIVFAEAVHGKGEAIEWFIRNNLKALLAITQKIRRLRDSQTFDYHKLHF
jgi:peptidoglycan/xylan/chitin deacetylase (PgdA/CDA1 family)